MTEATFVFESYSESDTDRLGRLLAEAVEPAVVVALAGGLGAGKTRLVRAIAQALDVDKRDVNSPTFVLIQHYDGRLPIHHVDTYRLADVDEFLELGAEELFESGGLCLIEWADRVADVLPDDRLRVDIQVTGPNSRRFCLSASGPKSQAVVSRLSAPRPPLASA